MTFEGYYVWNPNSNKPRFRHDSFDAAVRESERLARDFPGESFVVLEIKGVSVVEKPSPIFKPSLNDEIPF